MFRCRKCRKFSKASLLTNLPNVVTVELTRKCFYLRGAEGVGQAPLARNRGGRGKQRHNHCRKCLCVVHICIRVCHVYTCTYTGAYEVVEANAHSDLSSAENACAMCIHVYRCVICIQIYICTHMCMRFPNQTAAQTCMKTPVHCACVV